MRNYQYNKKRGQALLAVFFLLIAVGIVISALAIMWQVEIRTRSTEREGLAAFYLAQAGIEHAKIWARYNSGIYPYTSPWYSLAGGRYTFTVAFLGGNRRQIISTGQELDSLGNIIAQREIQVDISGIGTPPTVDDRQLAWSWREI